MKATAQPFPSPKKPQKWRYMRRRCSFNGSHQEQSAGKRPATGDPEHASLPSAQDRCAHDSTVDFATVTSAFVTSIVALILAVMADLASSSSDESGVNEEDD